MPQFKAQDLLQNATVAVSVGSRPAAQRNVFKALGAATLILAATTFGQAHAQDRASSFQGQSDQQVLSVQQGQMVGEVLSVRHVYDNSRRSHRGEISPRSIAGALIGGFIGHQFGGGDGRKLTTLAGALTGGSIANRLADRRAGRPAYDNARQVADNDEVVVRVQNGNGFETYEIIQPAGFELRRGDAVALMTSKDGKTLMALPIAYEPTSQPAQDNNSRAVLRRPGR